MRSHLARNACRASPGLAHLHVRHLSLASLSISRDQTRRPRLERAPLCLARPPSRRTFFGPFKKPPRDVKDPQIVRGYDLLLQFSASETDNVRPPSVPELVGAMRVFLTAMSSRQDPLNSTQAFCALRTLIHLSKQPPIDRSGEIIRMGGLRELELTKIQELVLRKPKAGATDDHLELAKVAYDCLCQINDKKPKLETPKFRRYITALAQYGAAAEATEALLAASQGRPVTADAHHLWIEILDGVAVKGDETSLLEMASKLELLGVSYCPRFQEILTAFYARRGNADAMLTWYHKATKRPRRSTLVELVRFARQHPDQAARVNEIFSGLCSSSQTPAKYMWAAILQWAVSVLGRDIDDVEPIVKSLAKNGERYPDIETINSLIEMAVEIKNPVLAERIWQWSHRLRLQPDMRSFELQLMYRLEAGDFLGAHGAFENLIRYPAADEFEEGTISILNKYLREICPQERIPSEQLISVLSTIEEYDVSLESETVAALCARFLKNDQQYEVMDTLSLHALHFSLEERATVRNVFVNYCLDDSNSTARVWDAYALLRQFFPETDQASRIKLMDAFFGRRKRPDMAILVFGHMRAHSNPTIRPDGAVYARALEQLGRYPDAESLRLIHNMLKMDTNIQLDTQLYNALMMAYTGCEDPETSLEFWREINSSPDGPTYNSLALFFWTCEKLPFGDAKAKEVWAKMQRMEIEVPDFVFGAYCGAIAGNGDLAAIKRLLERMDGASGYYPNTSMLRISYNALPGQQLQDDFEEWAKVQYPKLWTELETKVSRVKRLHNGSTEFKHPRDELKV